MEFLNQTYQLLHHTPRAIETVSQLDRVLLIIKSLSSVIGTLVIFSGVLVGAYRFAVWGFSTQKKRSQKHMGVDFIRRDLGRTLILGLEFIIAADVIETTTAPDYYSVGILAIIVVIRTFLSLTLNKEIASLTASQQDKLST